MMGYFFHSISIFVICGVPGLKIKLFPGSSSASSKATERCCEKKPVHLWAPSSNFREPKENSREPPAPPKALTKNMFVPLITC